MKRNERTIYNRLKKTVNSDTICCEIPMTFSEDGKQGIHELLTVEKHMYAACIAPDSMNHELCILYYPTRKASSREEIRMTQETMTISEIIASLPTSDYTWNGYKVEPTAPETAPEKQPKRNLDETLSVIEYLLSSKKAWTWNEIDQIIAISTGNLKLQSDENCRFIIWNIPARKTCPFATPLCSKNCYAIKSERNYPDVLPARSYNYELSRQPLFVPLMVRLLHEIAKKPAYQKARKIIVRIHESGDFYNVEYLKKWYDIARACKDIKNMHFAAYTKSLPYVETLKNDGVYRPVNLLIRASVWSDTAPSQLQIIHDMHFPIYTAYAPNEFPSDHFQCDCVNCATCQACFSEAVEKIACLIH